MLFTDTYICRLATNADRQEILSGLNLFCTHQHLDWETLSDQIESDSVFLCFRNTRLCGILSLTGSTTESQWIKIFAIRSESQKFLIWEKLFKFALSNGKTPTFYTIAFWDWYKKLIHDLPHYSAFDQIITLDASGIEQIRNVNQTNPIRKIMPVESQKAYDLDRVAFRPPWQLEQNNLASAIERSSISDCILFENQFAGYILADYDEFSAHLSRIAVHPNLSGQGLGSQLINHLFGKLLNKHVYVVTVNTQENNKASLALYHKFGFELTGEKIPVYLYNDT